MERPILKRPDRVHAIYGNRCAGSDLSGSHFRYEVAGDQVIFSIDIEPGDPDEVDDLLELLDDVVQFQIMHDGITDRICKVQSQNPATGWLLRLTLRRPARRIEMRIVDLEPDEFGHLCITVDQS